MTREEKSELIGNAVKQLAGDDRFKLFMLGIDEMKKSALLHACADATLANLGTAGAALGEVRAYIDIEELVAQHADVPLTT